MKIIKGLASASPAIKRNFLLRIGQIVFFDLLIALLLFISAGSFNWMLAWFYTGLMVFIQLVGSFLLPLDIIAERGSKKEYPEYWDKVITRLILPFYLGIYLVSGFDFRWQWSADFSSSWHLGAVLIFTMGGILQMWALSTNRFFSTTVRIQFDRGHVVCVNGPYKYVRHPGYVGFILYFAVTPLFLGSFWALIPAAFVVILFVIRTKLEDSTLQNKLSGYKEYAARVRYRLIPGIW